MTNDKMSKLLLALTEAKSDLAEAVYAEKLASDAAGVAFSAHILAEDAYEAADDADEAAGKATHAAKAAYEAADAAVDKAFETTTNVYLEPQPRDCLSHTDRAAIRESATGDITK